jgi:hypothetical protein
VVFRFSFEVKRDSVRIPVRLGGRLSFGANGEKTGKSDSIGYIQNSLFTLNPPDFGDFAFLRLFRKYGKVV